MTDSSFGVVGAFAYLLSPWESYLIQVEDICGRRFTDQVSVDMLYALYLGDVPPARAAEAAGGLEHVSGSISRVLADLERLRANNPLLNVTMEDVMRHDRAPDPTVRFAPGARARPALSRRRFGPQAEWRMAALSLGVAAAIAVLIALVLKGPW